MSKRRLVYMTLLEQHLMNNPSLNTDQNNSDEILATITQSCLSLSNFIWHTLTFLQRKTATTHLCGGKQSIRGDTDRYHWFDFHHNQDVHLFLPTNLYIDKIIYPIF